MFAAVRNICHTYPPVQVADFAAIEQSWIELIPAFYLLSIVL